MRILIRRFLQRFDVGLQKGDIVVLATDGVIDNVFPQETAALISVIQRRGDPPRMAAAGLAEFAKMRSVVGYTNEAMSYNIHTTLRGWICPAY